MMLDFGDTVESISEKTGFSATTVRRRLKMAELNQDTLKKVSSRQVSLFDFDKLAQIEDVEKRNEVLKEIGTANYERAIKNFDELKRLGYEFVMLRAGYGGYLRQKDRAFENHYAAALKAGLHIGAYHYSYATSVTEAKQEAKCFLDWIKGKRIDYPVAFDMEDRCQKGLTTKQRTDIALAWMQTVENAGYYTMLYCSADWAKNKLDMQRLKHFDVWLACYTTKERRDKLYTHPILGMWQYSSAVVLPGVYNSRLDHNVAYRDFAKIIKNTGLNRL